MNLKDAMKMVLEKFEFHEDGCDVKALIAYAYFKGRCEVAKELCDTSSKIFQEQKQRVNNCRYYNMALKIQGDKNFIYHGDYDNWIEMFSKDKLSKEVEHLITADIKQSDKQKETDDCEIEL